MTSQDEFDTALNWFCKEVGVLVNMIADGCSSQKKLSVKWLCDQVETTLNILERATPWENRAELYSGLLKEDVMKYMRVSNSTTFLWGYAIDLRDLIYNKAPRHLFQDQGKTHHECTFGNQSDIYNI